MGKFLRIAILGIFATLFGCRRNGGLDLPDTCLYFSRNATHDMMDDQIVAFDRNSPRVITMDPWPQTVFLAADGQHTIREFVQDLAKQYDDGPPRGLERQVRDAVARLAQEGLIILHENQRELHYYLSTRISEQDRTRAKALMEQDGYIKKDIKSEQPAAPSSTEPGAGES